MSKHRFTIYNTQIVKEYAKNYAASKFIKSPDAVIDIANEVLDIQNKTQEHFIMLALNTKNAVIGIHTVHIGSLNISVVHPRDVFQRAILNNAGAIMVLHNHPSGDPTPSNEDIEVTRRLIDAGEILGIDVLDHIIIGGGDPDIDTNYVSLRESAYVRF